MLSSKKRKLIAIGASTGGVEALDKILSRFPAEMPPMVLVLHMQIGFTKLFAARLNKKLAISVKEAQTGDLLLPGQLLVAPAGQHMIVVNRSGKMAVECYTGEKVQFVIPSADVLFNSVAEVFRQDALGIILTGIGADGASGLLKMRENGALTIGQDQATCSIYGMPKVAYEMGAVEFQLPLDRIADKILTSL